MKKKHSEINGWRTFCLDILSDVQVDLSSTSLKISDDKAFINFLKSNGILCLLLDSLEKQQKTAVLPESICKHMQEFRRTSSVSELYNKQTLLQTIELLSNRKIDCLLLKGSALAYDLYDKPYQRIRGDTDLLIHPADKGSVDTLLINNGYQKSVTVVGDYISHQSTYTIIYNNAGYCYDIHWKISNRNAFAELFDFDELFRRRQVVRGLTEKAFRLSNYDALLHAIVHYYGHFPDDRARLIWVYDLHLLCKRLKAVEWDGLLENARIKKLDPFVLEALKLSQATFKTQLPGYVLEKLERSPVRLNNIEYQRLSATEWSRIEQFKSDWAALNFRQRCQLIKEYLIPPSEFILRQNRSKNRLLLPYYYCKRVLIGGMNLMKKTLTR